VQAHPISHLPPRRADQDPALGGARHDLWHACASPPAWSKRPSGCAIARRSTTGRAITGG